MDPELMSRLMEMFNPIGSAQAQMLGPSMASAPPGPGAGIPPVQGLGGEILDSAVPNPPAPRASQLPGQTIPPMPIMTPPPPTIAGAVEPPPPPPGAAAAAPGVSSVPTPSNPMQRPSEPYRSEPYGGPTVGSVLEPTAPLPRPRPEAAGAAVSGTDKSNAEFSNKLQKSLQGVQMPKAAEPQKITTPHAPQLKPIQSNLADLFSTLGITPGQAMGGGGLKLPSTLGQALGGR